jgi:hypothetical protein
VDELEHLRKLIALRQLTFADEHFGSNPIVSHPDYRSFAITTLKQVCSLLFACSKGLLTHKALGCAIVGPAGRDSGWK